MKLAIITREETMAKCTGSGCLKACFQRLDAFARYDKETELELIAFTHNGGDIEKKFESLRSKGVDCVHLSSCLRGKDPDYERLARRCSEYFAVVGYTHGGETARSGQKTVVLDPVPKTKEGGECIVDTQES